MFRHIGCVYTIIGAFCQETQSRCKPTSGPDCSVEQQSACSHHSSSFLLFCVPCNSQSFPGASDVLLSISGGSWHQSLYHGVVQADFACLEGGGVTLQLKKSLKNSYKIVSCLAHGGFLWTTQSGETSPNRVKQVRVNIKISNLSPKHYPNLGKQGNPNS